MAEGYGPGGVEKTRNPLRNVIFYPSCFVIIVMSKKSKLRYSILQISPHAKKFSVNYTNSSPTENI